MILWFDFLFRVFLQTGFNILLEKEKMSRERDTERRGWRRENNTGGDGKDRKMFLTSFIKQRTLTNQSDVDLLISTWQSGYGSGTEQWVPRMHWKFCPPGGVM